MNHRRSRSENDLPAEAEIDDTESVCSSDSVKTIDLYYGWKLPEIEFTVKLPGWFVVLVTLLIFRGPTSC
jgi:hypothetical protein